MSNLTKDNRSINRLQFFAAIWIVFGILRFLPEIKIIQFILAHIDRVRLDNSALLFNIIDKVFFPLCFIVSGIFLLRLRRIGRLLLFMMLAVDGTFRLSTIINYWYALRTCSQTIPAAPQMTVTISLPWPLYIILIAELFSLVYLLRTATEEMLR